MAPESTLTDLSNMSPATPHEHASSLEQGIVSTMEPDIATESEPGALQSLETKELSSNGTQADHVGDEVSCPHRIDCALTNIA